MTACLVARSATIALRRRKTKRVVTVAFPWLWSRSTLLAYVRREHPGETARIVEWHDTHEGFEPVLWLANPDGFSDYKRGVAA